MKNSKHYQYQKDERLKKRQKVYGQILFLLGAFGSVFVFLFLIIHVVMGAVK